MIKSFEEVKKIIEKFPEASGVGYVVASQLLKIANKLGLPGEYENALCNWFSSGVLGERVYKTAIEAIENGAKLVVNWDGLPLLKVNHKGEHTFVVGLKALIEEIEKAAKVL